MKQVKSLSSNQQEEVSRSEEVRAIFIFGLLAVFAYVKTQYKTLTLTYSYGSFNLIPLINILIILWSMYAFFMVLGLSEDTIGKIAYSFKQGSKMFLQFSFMLLGVFAVLFGFIVYGLRLLYGLAIILGVLIASLVIYLHRRPKPLRKGFGLVLSFRSLKKYRALFLGLTFLTSITIILYYPNSWLESSYVIFAFFIIALLSAALILAYQDRKIDKTTDDFNI